MSETATKERAPEVREDGAEAVTEAQEEHAEPSVERPRVCIGVGTEVLALKDNDLNEPGVVVSVSEHGCFVQHGETGEIFATLWSGVKAYVDGPIVPGGDSGPSPEDDVAKTDRMAYPAQTTAPLSVPESVLRDPCKLRTAAHRCVDRMIAKRSMQWVQVAIENAIDGWEESDPGSGPLEYQTIFRELLGDGPVDADDDTVSRKHVRAAIDRWVARSREIAATVHMLKTLVGDSGELMQSGDTLRLSGLSINGLRVAADTLLARLDNHIDDMAAAFEGDTPDNIPTAWKPAGQRDTIEKPGPAHANDRDRTGGETGSVADDEGDDQPTLAASPLDIKYVMDTERLAKAAVTLADEAVSHGSDEDAFERFVVPVSEVIGVVLKRIKVMVGMLDPRWADDDVGELRRDS